MSALSRWLSSCECVRPGDATLRRVSVSCVSVSRVCQCQVCVYVSSVCVQCVCPVCVCAECVSLPMWVPLWSAAVPIVPYVGHVMWSVAVYGMWSVAGHGMALIYGLSLWDIMLGMVWM